MEGETKFKVEERVIEMLEESKKLEAGSKERSILIDDASKLLHSLNEDDRNGCEYSIKTDQLREQVKDKKIDTILRGCDIGVKLLCFAATVWEIVIQRKAHYDGIKFEETGTVTGFYNKQNENRFFRKHDFRSR